MKKDTDQAAAMERMVAEVEKILPTVTWKPMEMGEKLTAFTGTEPTETWAFTVAGDGAQHYEGVGIHEPSGTILHLPPELAKRAWDLAKERA